MENEVTQFSTGYDGVIIYLHTSQTLDHKCGTRICVNIRYYKIVRIVRALSLVNSCDFDESMETRLWHHTSFDWLCIVRRAF